MAFKGKCPINSKTVTLNLIIVQGSHFNYLGSDFLMKLPYITVKYMSIKEYVR